MIRRSACVKKGVNAPIRGSPASAGNSATIVSGKYRPTRSTLGTINPDDRRWTARASLGREAPDRTRQIHVEPAVSERGPARRHAVLQPRVPHAHKRIGRAPAQEIAVARQLPVQAYVHGA